MTVIIQIHYIATESKTKAFQQGTFKLRGKKSEQVAYDFWKWIKREMPVEVELEKVLVENEDKTELVRELEKAPLD
jgi:hypothetical protein